MRVFARRQRHLDDVPIAGHRLLGYMRKLGFARTLCTMCSSVVSVHRQLIGDMHEHTRCGTD